MNQSDIAIVGMAIRVPGASTPEQYWNNLASGIESVETYSDEELLARNVSPKALADSNYVRAGMPLQDYDQFDAEFFGFSPKEAAILDPQHRQFYEVAWEALERAGHPPSAFDGSVGVFAGCGMGAYFALNLLSRRELLDSVGLFLLRHTGNDKDFLATRVSYAFDLKGPSINVQTACSTSLVATHMAIQSLLSGECDLALAGGSTVEVPHRVGYRYKEGEVLSPDGHCRAFDHRSKGTVFGSGSGVVALRRLEDAVADGDHVHAVIRGSAVNNDGSSKVGYLAPSVDGQAAAIAEALAIADVSAETVGYVECHGTATPVGDPIEIAALTRAFRESTDRKGYCLVASVKTNIGHLDTAAGVAGLIKAALALEHGKIPPSLHFEKPNPVIDFDDSPFRVATELSEWADTSEPRRAAVNSLGVGGTNAFVILEEAPELPRREVPAGPEVLLLSARSKRALDDASGRLAEWLKLNPDVPLADVAYTLRVGRHPFDQRRVLACSSHGEAIGLLESADPRRVFTHTREVERPSVVFMYPGGGAQYFQMGRGLYQSEPLFREHVDRGLSILKSRFDSDLTSYFFADKAQREQNERDLAKPAIQLPLTFIVEYALTRLLEEYGLTPDAVIGHSMGENTAACVAGVFNFEDALGLLLLRGQLIEQTPKGGMLSIPMPPEELRGRLGSNLDLAAANSPQLSVASGAQADLDALQEELAAEGIEAQRVKVDVAAHSRLLDGILDKFRAYLDSIELSEPNIDIVSNLTGDWLAPEKARDPAYWVDHLRNTVRYADGVNTLLSRPEPVFLEVGPGNMLGSFVRQNSEAPTQRILASMRHPQDTSGDDAYLRAALGRLWAVGVPVDLSRLQPGERRRVPMPAYPFQHARYWIDPAEASEHPVDEFVEPERLAELGDWFQRVDWVQQGILDTDTAPCDWLVFDNGEPLLDALVQRLRDRGHRLVTVQAGDTFARLGPDRYSLAPEAGGAGYQDLANALVEEGFRPDRLIHGWLLTREQSFRPGSTFFHRNQDYGFYSLFHLVRAFAKAGMAEHDQHWIVLSNGMQRVADEALVNPDKATVLGACEVIPREFPRISCRSVDVGIELAPAVRGANLRKPESAVDDSLLGQLEAEICATAANEVVVWRQGVRWLRRIVRQADAGDVEQNRLKKNGVYLITGGLGGIGAAIASWLARQYQARIVLIGRSPLPPPEDWGDWLRNHDSDDPICRMIGKLRKLEGEGATVLPLAADVTVAEQMQDAIDQAKRTFGEINGVFHAAGVIRDNLIQLKSPRDIEEVFAAKVYGTVVLDEIFQRQSLDFMILFSSTSAFIAPQGQIDYVAANSFINAFAASCVGTRAYPVTAINWGIWRDVGLAAPVKPLSAAAALDAEVEHATASDVKYPLFSKHYSARDGVAAVHLYEGRLMAGRDWVVDEHRLGSGEALLSGTGYIELIRAALAESGVTEPWQLSNLIFENAMFVPDDEPREFRVRLRGEAARWDAIVFARGLGEQADAWQECARARVEAGSTVAPVSVDVAALEREFDGQTSGTGGSGRLRTRQEDHLKFGPRWRALRQLKLGQQDALAHVELMSEYRDDLAVYALHPALLDISTGYAMDLIPGYGDQEVAQNLWVPAGYQKLVYHAPLSAHLVSRVRLGQQTSVKDGFAAFDISIHDSTGQLLVEVEGLMLRRSETALRRPVEPAPSPGADGGPAPSQDKALSPAEAALQHNVTRGIGTEDGMEALGRVLSGTMPPTAIVSSMDVRDLIRQADVISRASEAGEEALFARPELDSEFEAPRDDLEKELAELWGKLLGVESIGIRDSFFDLGGHSLIAVRLFNELSDRYGVEMPMSVLMQSPNIAGLSELLRGQGVASTVTAGEATADSTPRGPRMQHVVAMHTGSVASGTPLFVVSGMFGNVLNLSHLANLLGEDRPFYALQARGLYGDAEPHETFEEMAEAYLAEIRQVQPQGPYLLAGFSGGGLVAFEMARRLLNEGQQVLSVLMLDTPVREVPNFSLADKFSMLFQGIRAKGPGFLLEKWQRRQAWKREQQELREQAASPETDRIQFQSQRIGDAFTRAVTVYEMPTVDVSVALFRPKLNVQYHLSGGRMVDHKRDYISPDNGWTPHCAALDVFEVPGDHDSMVLEPNVRVLVGRIRRVIDLAEAAASSPAGDSDSDEPGPAVAERLAG